MIYRTICLLFNVYIINSVCLGDSEHLRTEEICFRCYWWNPSTLILSFCDLCNIFLIRWIFLFISISVNFLMYNKNLLLMFDIFRYALGLKYFSVTYYDHFCEYEIDNCYKLWYLVGLNQTYHICDHLGHYRDIQIWKRYIKLLILSCIKLLVPDLYEYFSAYWCFLWFFEGVIDVWFFQSLIYSRITRYYFFRLTVNLNH